MHYVRLDWCVGAAVLAAVAVGVGCMGGQSASTPDGEPSVGDRSAAVWDGETEDDRVVRIDPRTLRIVRTLHLGGAVPSVAFGFGSVWAAVRGGSVVRFEPGRRLSLVEPK